MADVGSPPAVGAAAAAPGAVVAGSSAVDTKWVSASAELRSTAKWVITALAAVATVVFGAGPVISRPNLDFHDDAVQLVISAALGVAGLVGIGMLIFGVSKVLLPVEMSLDDLPAELVAKINAAPATVLPADAHDLREFRDQLASYRVASVELPDKAEDADQQAAEAGRRSEKADAMRAARAYRAAYDDAVANLAVYESVRTDLLDRGAYTKLSQVFSSKQTSLIVGALLAGIGGLGFQLALTSAPDSDKSAAPAAAVNQVAILTRSGDQAKEVWASYRLEGCETSPGQVPVLVTGGAGTADSPYVVQTVPSKAGCPAISFTAYPEVFGLVVPKPQTVAITIAKK
ncbi:hypothetical protein [Kribbella speibonae]|uniref:Uncharacterized protein n=1 Tax=Kribbella speibonae TaxID=1572660 RepID=A0A4V2M4K3_9ACTN|nr:hypothetical protein [Kribbella speibonae]TCC36332.1 hypothetical protein E0H92_27160 [Kribbella speibonae]